MFWALVLIFCVGFFLGLAAGSRRGWNRHVTYKLNEAIQKATDVAESERK